MTGFMNLLPWVGFLAFIVVMLALDLGVFHREARAISRREALIWSGIWIGLALIFNAGVYLTKGTEAGIEWTTGYLLEYSLSVDNVFVMLLIFSTFLVPPIYQHRVLFWGILGAVVMRGILILFAGFLLDRLHWMIYVFGAFLIFTGWRFIRGGDHVADVSDNRLVNFAKRFMPVTEKYEGQKFFTRRNGVRAMTPLFLVLLLIESTDLIFAVDSIPAIYAVTDDPFIVFTSNAFAILGLRSLFFVLSGYLSGMVYLKPALAAIMAFVGSKMVLIDVVKIPPLISLGVIGGILTVAILASLRVRDNAPVDANQDDPADAARSSAPLPGN
ncbi:MAG: TerC family protein [Thermomicrobiales bacterium]|nr:TerC family protein [Thermomicrobiales bacterium]